MHRKCRLQQRVYAARLPRIRPEGGPHGGQTRTGSASFSVCERAGMAPLGSHRSWGLVRYELSMCSNCWQCRMPALPLPKRAPGAGLHSGGAPRIGPHTCPRCRRPVGTGLGMRARFQATTAWLCAIYAHPSRTQQNRLRSLCMAHLLGPDSAKALVPDSAEDNADYLALAAGLQCGSGASSARGYVWLQRCMRP